MDISMKAVKVEMVRKANKEAEKEIEQASEPTKKAQVARTSGKWEDS